MANSDNSLNLSRRDMMKLGAAGVIGTSMSGWLGVLASHAAQNAPTPGTPRRKNCIEARRHRLRHHVPRKIEKDHMHAMGTPEIESRGTSQIQYRRPQLSLADRPLDGRHVSQQHDARIL